MEKDMNNIIVKLIMKNDNRDNINVQLIMKMTTWTTLL